MSRALASREQLTERLEKHITTVVTRYKDDIKYWDVFNEVLNSNSIRQVADDSWWAEIIGDVDGNGYADDYVEIGFRAARAADEDAVLIINDFNMEWQDSKTQAMYDMVERMLRKGVRIDGVGFQSHIGLDTNVEHYRKQIEKIAGLSAIYDECFPEYAGKVRVLGDISDPFGGDLERYKMCLGDIKEGIRAVFPYIFEDENRDTQSDSE